LLEKIGELEERLLQIDADLAHLKTQGPNVPKTKRVQIVLAYILSLVIPYVTVEVRWALIALFPVMYPHDPVPELLLFLYLGMLSPLPLGFWAGLAWPGRHPKYYILIGLFAGSIQALMGGFGGYYLGLPLFTLGGWNKQDIVIAIATAALLSSGGLFADLWKERKSPPEARGSRVAGRLAARLPGARAEPSNNTILLIQALGPSIFALIGTSFTAIASLTVAGRL